MRILGLVFAGLTQLDLAGPMQALTKLPGAVVQTAGADLDPIATDSGFALVPTATLEAAPQADVLLIPGGPGTFDVLGDDRLLSFIRDQAAGASIVASVCTGAFLLGAAGLLHEREATTHWASLPMLSLLGARPVSRRVVWVGERLVTSAGVSSGIDMALQIAARLTSPEVARQIQLGIEYDPEPPFDAGSPARPQADPGFVADRLARNERDRSQAVRTAARALADQG